MDRPGITDDQREMAIVLLANALRKDAHLRNRSRQPGEQDFLHAGLARRRSEASQRYVDGMRDMLRALFPNGDQVVHECMEEAYARAMGVPPIDASGGAMMQ
jgi:hypothetical protein